MRDRRARLKEAGLCGQCGRKPHKPDRTWCQKCLDKRKEWYHKSDYKIRHAGIRRKNRLAVIEHYGGGCECCGETELAFLAIDHPKDDGKKERDQYGYGSTFYGWLIRNNFPEGYRVLCHNCNFGRHINGGVCPHQQGTIVPEYETIGDLGDIVKMAKEARWDTVKAEMCVDCNASTAATMWGISGVDYRNGDTRCFRCAMKRCRDEEGGVAP